MKGGAHEALDARDMWNQWTAELTRAADERTSRIAIARLRIDAPAAFGLIPGRLRRFGRKAKVGRQLVLARDALKVGEDLRLRRIHARPVRIRLEGIRVEHRRDVARAARIGIARPCAAELAPALEHDEVAPALLEPNRRKQSSHSRTDDDCVEHGLASLVTGDQPTRARIRTRYTPNILSSRLLKNSFNYLLARATDGSTQVDWVWHALSKCLISGVQRKPRQCLS